MAISANNQKLAVMEWCQVWEPGLPFDPVAIDIYAQQQFLGNYPGQAGEEHDMAYYHYYFRRKLYGRT